MYFCKLWKSECPRLRCIGSYCDYRIGRVAIWNFRELVTFTSHLHQNTKLPHYYFNCVVHQWEGWTTKSMLLPQILPHQLILPLSQTKMWNAPTPGRKDLFLLFSRPLVDPTLQISKIRDVLENSMRWQFAPVMRRGQQKLLNPIKHP